MKFVTHRGTYMEIKVLEQALNRVEIREPLEQIQNYSEFLYLHSLQAAWLTGNLILNSEKTKILQEFPYFEQCLMGALIHDYGKVGKPVTVIRKKTTLTKPQMSMYKKHTEDGYQRLITKNLPLVIYQMILKHHEKIDGRGFPFQLRNEQVPLECRALTVVDSFLALTYLQRDLNKEKMLNRCMNKFYERLIEDPGLDKQLVEDFFFLTKETILQTFF